jgi:hypothetical protein
VLGATRGEGDLGPVLPWAKRYSEWLRDRVRLNRQRTRQGVFVVKVADDGLVRDKRQQLRTDNPVQAGIYVHGPGEEVSMPNLGLRAGDVSEDGRVLRLAVAGGANVALHYLGEGESTNYATAREMGEPTARFYTDRQTELRWFLADLVETAYRRKVALGLATLPRGGDFKISTNATDVARVDNESLAVAAKDIVAALREMWDMGWIDRETATRMAFKFAGEVLGDEEIRKVLEDRAREGVAALRAMRDEGLMGGEITMRRASKFAGLFLGDEEIARILEARGQVGQADVDLEGENVSGD